MAYSTTHRMTTATFAAWLRGQLGVASSEATVVEGRIADMPSLSVSVSISGPSGVEMEGAFETIGIHLQCRGFPNNLDTAETLALLVDDIILNSPVNFHMPPPDGGGGGGEGVYVTSLWRPGPRPQQLTFPDTEDRFVFATNYMGQCETGANKSSTLPGLG